MSHQFSPATSSCINKHERNGLEILIRGTVQGVGFRPFVYSLAARLKVSGTVQNSSNGVIIHAVAASETLKVFCLALKNEAPPLARITSIDIVPKKVSVTGDSFTIIPSVGGESANTSIPADIAICDDCLAELADPEDHRFGYPFINCTNCGPRFTIVERIPYDRPYTSMKVFPMCPVCKGQYDDPGDRRFHAQPNACAHCGPHLELVDTQNNPVTSSSALSGAATLLHQGKILAMRGLGGFHLCVDGYSESAVAKLRTRKGRPDKPLAVMMPDLEKVKHHCQVTEEEEQLLTSHKRPIVLLRKKKSSTLASNLAPNIMEMGVMLPYTPAQQLLFMEQSCPDCLVMTSGNISGNPICTSNEDGMEKLQSIADGHLLHNREIVTRVDDSVARVVGKTTHVLRRARGYVPNGLEIPWEIPSGIGCGAGLKSSFCLGRKNSVYPSQHIGDLFNLESLEFYQESVDHLKKVFQIEPEIAVCDLHPDYLSSHYGKKLGLPLYQVQHHHAHAVAVMAEHGITEPVLAVVFDGTGFGPDNTIWGGEILQADLTSYTRLAHLDHLLLPGGDLAVAEPWRLGMASLYQLSEGDSLEQMGLTAGLKQLSQEKLKVVHAMLASEFNTPRTSSCGRLFDAVASLLNIRQEISYEGQAAIELESLARKATTSSWLNQISEFSNTASKSLLHHDGEKWRICSLEFVRILLASLANNTSPGSIALQFHYLLINSVTHILQRLSEQTGIKRIVLTGGCMQNSLLLEGLFHTLTADNFTIFTGEDIPINDGGISLGQIIIGGLQHVSCNSHEGHQG